MKVLILGGKGRLGGALARIWSTGHDLRTMSRPELDVADLQGLRISSDRQFTMCSLIARV